MFASELKNKIDSACNEHLAVFRAAGDMSLPPDLKILVPYFNENMEFIGYDTPKVYYDVPMGALIIEQDMGQ